MTNNIQEKLDKLENNIDSLKNKTKKTGEGKNNTAGNMRYVMQITVDLLSGLAVGAFIGYEIDKYFETKPLYFIVFMILGMAGGFLNLIRNLNK